MAINVIAMPASEASNAALGVWQERKAESAVAKLRDLAAPQVWVLRDGVTTRLAARDLVTGEYVSMEVGERVPAVAGHQQAGAAVGCL